MSRDRDVDAHLESLFVPPDPALDAALAASDAAGLPRHEVSPLQGKLLHLLARVHGARAILELGTLGGYSTIWLARALPRDGRLVTLELDPIRAALARANVDRAGLAGRVEVRCGAALELLPSIDGPFDLVFLDADKARSPAYLEHALRLTRPGALIIADNTVRAGAILDATSDDPSVRGIRRFHELVAADPRLDATAIQTVGRKGHDGFTLIRVRDPEHD